jgi:hypothetical protein
LTYEDKDSKKLEESNADDDKPRFSDSNELTEEPVFKTKGVADGDVPKDVQEPTVHERNGSVSSNAKEEEPTCNISKVQPPKLRLKLKLACKPPGPTLDTTTVKAIMPSTAPAPVSKILLKKLNKKAPKGAKEETNRRKSNRLSKKCAKD